MARDIFTPAKLALAALCGVSAAPNLWAGPARAAEPVMVQCGREYQAAKSANALNGMDWNAFRAACASRLKASTAAAAPAAAPADAPAAAPAAVPAAVPTPTVAAQTPALAAPTPPSAAASAPSAGTTAMRARQKQCGAEWTANKATLVAATPGLTWPKYWSQCNARLKAAPAAAR